MKKNIIIIWMIKLLFFKDVKKGWSYMLLFVCCAPFHIISAINLATNHYGNEKKDIIITDHSEGNYKSYLELKKYGIFNNVYFIKSNVVKSGNSNNQLFRYIRTLAYFINSKVILSQIDSNITYDSIFISSPDITSEIIYYYYKKRSKHTKLFMYDEGTFAYNYFNYKVNMFKKIFIKVFYGRDIMNEHSGAYVYRPEYLETNKPININKLEMMNKFNFESLSIINNIIGYEAIYSEGLDSKYIYFDQAFQFEQIISDGIEILNLILKYVEQTDIVVKLHPRTNKNMYQNLCKVIDMPIPYEIITLNSKISNKVLISIYSTACLNPKIIFDEEPYVILLFKLVDLSLLTPHLSRNSFDLAYKVKDSYINSNRLFIPETVEELQEILIYLEKGTLEEKI